MDVPREPLPSGVEWRKSHFYGREYKAKRMEPGQAKCVLTLVEDDVFQIACGAPRVDAAAFSFS